MSNTPRKSAVAKTALILSFDTPSPVDYGGIYDVVSRAKALREIGYAVDYVGVAVDKTRLTRWGTECEQSDEPFRCVYILRGRAAMRYVLAVRPASALRRNVPIPADMQAYLTAQQYSVILIDHIKMVPFAQRILPKLQGNVRLRMHNDEAQYYASLSRRERGCLRASVLWLESVKYSRYQKKVLTSRMVRRVYYISREDQIRLSKANGPPGIVLPVVADVVKAAALGTPFSGRTIDFIYVGNLDIEENLKGIKSALQFLESNGVRVDVALICGRCTEAERQRVVLEELVAFSFCEVKFNIPRLELYDLYQKAKFFLNFATATGGVKTKLIDALAQGLVVITNELGVRGSGLEEACIIASKTTIPLISSALVVEAEYEQLRAASTAALGRYAMHVRSIYESEFGADHYRVLGRE